MSLIPNIGPVGSPGPGKPVLRRPFFVAKRRERRDKVELSLPQASEALTGRYRGEASLVSMGCWAVVNRDQPLATLDLEACRALALYDDSQQFLAHFPPESTVSQIKSALSEASDTYQLDLADCARQIVRGTLPNRPLERNIQKALAELVPNQPGEIEIFHHEGRKPGGKPVSIALADGELLRYPKARPVFNAVDEHTIRG